MTRGSQHQSSDPPDFIALSRERLRGYDPHRIAAPESRPSAVLLLLHHKGGEDRVVLTVRSNDVGHHKGQISFPGGAVHAADADLQTTALRETWEEIGVRPRDVELLGQLDDLITGTNFIVTPFVGALERGPVEYLPNPAEVAEVIEPPVSLLLDPATVRWEERQVASRPGRSPAYLYGAHRIWGATARILHEYLAVLTADDQALNRARRERRG